MIRPLDDNVEAIFCKPRASGDDPNALEKGEEFV